MKFVIAPDSFKGSLTSKQVANLIKQGVQRVFPNASYVLIPMADGGEGTVESLVDATDGHLVYTRVLNPFHQTIDAYYGILGNGKTAIIEMSQASGFQYIRNHPKNPMITTTFGTGELIEDALDHGVEEIIIGLGGSATVDGGAGMAQALGAHLLDQNNHEIPFGGGNLNLLSKVDISAIDSRLSATKIMVACDVLNPLTGSTGAAKMFGPQKGANADQVNQLENNLIHYSDVIEHDLKVKIANVPGSGAAGGLGAGLLAFTNATFYRGVDLVLKYSQFSEKVQNADFVFTGEGKIDSQTQLGKTPFGVAQEAKEVVPGVPVIALAGNLGEGIEQLLHERVIDAVYATPCGVKSLKQAIEDSPDDIMLTSENVARLIKMIRNS